MSGIREAYLILTGLELDLEGEIKDTKQKVVNKPRNFTKKQHIKREPEINSKVLSDDEKISVREQSGDQISDIHS